MTEYRIGKADTRAKYEGLRDLWERVFGDGPGFVDHVYRVFGAAGDAEDAGERARTHDKNCASETAGRTDAGADARAVGDTGDAGSDDRAPADIEGYVVCDEAGKVVSALTCYKCGELAAPGSISGRPVFVSYAVCTDPGYRGLGLAGRLTEYVSRAVTSDAGKVLQPETIRLGDACILQMDEARGCGGVSLVSPAEESLIRFYRGLGYRESCFVSEGLAYPEDEDTFIPDHAPAAKTRVWGLGPDGRPGYLDPVSTDEAYTAPEQELNIEHVDVSTYNIYRESFLKDIPHVAMSPAMLEFVRYCSLDGDGLLLVNGGDAVCAVSEAGKAGIILNELLINPDLLALSGEIAEEIAAGISEFFGRKLIAGERTRAEYGQGTVYRMPACGADASGEQMGAAGEGLTVRKCQAMSAGAKEAEFYFGFPVE